ncbi:MAG: hypothetical protein LBE35_08745 [Clostridiales bacterium]|jgi:cellobiose-specific phosphotransferase system component IIB|nr:hypothetical protein [Clostridiales bacterium]
MKKILFITSQYRATDILVQRTMDMAKKEGIELKFEVKGETEAFALLAQEDFDLILLNPMLRFLVNNTGENALPKGIRVETIGSKTYGSLDAASLLQLIMKNE